MKKIFLLLFLLPLIAIGQTKNVVSADRYFPKQAKSEAFEKAIAAHAKKYHKGDFQWRMYYIETGPDAGGYHIVEGPKNWESIDKRGDLGAEHMKDWNTTIEPLLTERRTSGFSTYREDLSSVKLTEFTEKISITHWFFRPGYYGEVISNIQGLKKLWEADGSTVAVYESSLSGDPQFAIVTRFSKGLKVRDNPNTASMNVRYSSANGPTGWETYIANMRQAIIRQYTELLTLVPLN